jgi:hypothetical protein
MDCGLVERREGRGESKQREFRSYHRKAKQDVTEIGDHGKGDRSDVWGAGWNREGKTGDRSNIHGNRGRVGCLDMNRGRVGCLDMNRGHGKTRGQVKYPSSCKGARSVVAVGT